MPCSPHFHSGPADRLVEGRWHLSRDTECFCCGPGGGWYLEHEFWAGLGDWADSIKQRTSLRLDYTIDWGNAGGQGRRMRKVWRGLGEEICGQVSPRQLEPTANSYGRIAGVLSRGPELSDNCVWPQYWEHLPEEPSLFWIPDFSVFPVFEKVRVRRKGFLSEEYAYTCFIHMLSLDKLAKKSVSPYENEALEQRSPKWGPRTSSISLMDKLVSNVHSWVPLRPPESEPLTSPSGDSGEGLFKPHLGRDIKASLLGEMAVSQAPVTSCPGREVSYLWSPESKQWCWVWWAGLSPTPRLLSAVFYESICKDPGEVTAYLSYVSVSKRYAEDSHINIYTCFFKSQLAMSNLIKSENGKRGHTDLEWQVAGMEPLSCALGAKQKWRTRSRRKGYKNV